jgi:phosphoribosylamine-glycine ligase
MREEVNLLIGQGQREAAIRHYHEKSSCSIESAVIYVNQVSAERLRHQREQLNKTRALYLV